MWFVDILSGIALEDDDPLTAERKGAGAEIIDISSEEAEDEEKITTEETTTKTVIEGKTKASETVVTKKLKATKTTMSQHGFVESILNCCHCLATCCVFTYVLCPPVPSCIIRKVAFRPPKQGESYKLIVKDKHGKEKYVDSARAASKYSSVKIEPILLELRQPNAQLLQSFMQPVDGFIVKSKSGNSIVCAHFKNKYTNRRTTTKMYENKVAIFAQPNSSDIGHFMQPFIVSFQDFANSIGIDLYGFDYSGYGRSGGSASEQNAYDDIESVFAEIVKRRGSEIEILLIGFSIGTTAVIDLASKKPKNLFGIVLIAPFTSGVRLLKNNPRLEKTPWYDCFESYSKISHVEVPVLVCHGTEDSMIPLLHGQVLYERAPQKVDPVIIEGATHVSILQSQHVHLAIRLFVAKQLLKTSSPLKEISTLNRSDSNSDEEK
uniref:Serine aminopeptidase S33 domain-containing protein n=1 Tax=Panagrolaimus sp. ES5 TaxID=591445 RepID=A0AC34F4L8_9BILA